MFINKQARMADRHQQTSVLTWRIPIHVVVACSLNFISCCYCLAVGMADGKTR